MITYFLVRITWVYGGKEVFLIGSFTNWDYMLKMHKNATEANPLFEISMVRFLILVWLK